MLSLFRYKLAQGEIEQIAKIYQSGISIMTINRVYGFSFRSRVIENALHRAGIEVREGRRKIPLSKENEIVKEYQSGISSHKLAKKYGMTFGAICSLLERNNCARSNRVLNDEQELQLIQEYQAGKSAQALNEQFGTTNAHRTLKRHKIKTRKPGYNSRIYQLNESAFDDLSSEASAYWLGFGYAEGSINKETFSIALSIKDINHLEKFRLFLQYEAPIKTYQTKTPQGNLKEVCRLSVHSQKLSRRLRTLGIVKKRRWFYQLLLDNLPKEMYRHFIRGIVDGDGSLDISHRNNARLRICEQKDLLTWIAKTFETELGVPFREPRQRTGIMELEYGGGLQARTIITWLYQDTTIFLERKINKMKWWDKEKSGS